MEDQKPLAEYLYQVLKPVVRTLMRGGFSARNAADLVRWAYVQVFYETPEFWRKKPSALLCSLKTGISRAEIPALRKIENPVDTQRAERRNRAARVLFAWTNDPDFHVDGKADWLPMDGCGDSGVPSFRQLVMRYESDARYQTVLDDLIDVGCVAHDDGVVQLISATYGSNAHLEKLGVVGMMSRRNGETIDHNLCADKSEDRRLHRVWFQRSVPLDRVDEVRRETKRAGEEFGRQMDRYLASVSHDTRQPGVKYAEMGVVIFGYEDTINVGAQISDLKEEGEEE